MSQQSGHWTFGFFVLCYFQVERTLGRLEQVANFSEFVKAFSVFGAEMVELAHVTGRKFKINIFVFIYYLYKILSGMVTINSNS